MLTDSKFFQGSFQYLQDIRNAGVTCPLLCKEFVIEVGRGGGNVVPMLVVMLVLACIGDDDDILQVLMVMLKMVSMVFNSAWSCVPS